MEAGRWQVHDRDIPTFRHAVCEYRHHVAHRMKGASTYRYRFDEFEKLPFAGRRIDEVQARDLAQWRDEQLRRLKPGTVVRKLAMLSAIFSWARKEQGWITENPMSLVRKPRSSDARARTLTAIEEHWLMKAAQTSKAEWLPAALTILMRSAMRRGELCQLRVGDVDLEAAVVHLRDTKNGEPRDVPLCPRAVEALRALGDAARARGDANLLPIGPAGSLTTRFRVTVTRAQAMYRAARAASGAPPDPAFLANLRLHDLRHHAVTTWAGSGALSLLELMCVSGHKSTRMLARYTHLQAASLATKLAKVTTGAAAPR